MHLFAQLVCLPVPEAAADRYAQIKRETERKGTPLDENDLWIAATALSLDAVVVTTDSDFRRVSGLRVENWTQ
jgi:tRNA(fMet)-specific endonuclease VapC